MRSIWKDRMKFLGERLNALTRKTHAFAKASETWDAF